MYSYQCGLQSIENRANVQTKGSGFDQYVDFNIRLSKNSSQPSNQGYVKLLQGMMSMADFIGKFSEGYKCCYVCEIEEFETLPQGAKSGIYENTLLFGYTSTRTDLVSFLCFVVLSGKGSLKYEGVDYELGAGDCVFIDCRKAYSHSTSDDLWSLQWCHFYAPSLPAVYEKYKERGGRPVFHPADIEPFTTLLTDIYDLALSSDYIRDVRINEKLGTLLTLLMEQSWHPESMTVSRKRLELAAVKEYLDEHYTEKIALDDLSEHFFINKFYLSKIFRKTYGTTVNNYLISKRITRAKQLLRFTDMTVDEIGAAVGMADANYFSRMFRKVEGISPREYRKPIIIETRRFEDFRGWMSVSAEGFHVLQINQGFSKKAGTLRGLHFQEGEYVQTKLVSCLHGSIFNVAVDLRPGENYGHAYGEILSFENQKQMYIPRGFAHGYLTLEDDTLMQWCVDNDFCAAAAKAVRYDSEFNW